MLGLDISISLLDLVQSGPESGAVDSGKTRIPSSIAFDPSDYRRTHIHSGAFRENSTEILHADTHWNTSSRYPLPWQFDSQSSMYDVYVWPPSGESKIGIWLHWKYLHVQKDPCLRVSPWRFTGLRHRQPWSIPKRQDHWLKSIPYQSMLIRVLL